MQWLKNSFKQKVRYAITLTLFKMGETNRDPSSTSVSLVTSTSVGIRSFWLLALTFFPHWCKMAWSQLVLVLNYWTWTKNTHQKSSFFWSNSCKVKVMINSLIKMT